MNNNQSFSVQELSQLDGKNGKPAYVAYKGKVYDVSGKDLTQQMAVAPHAEDVMDRMKIVGVLVPP